MKYIIANWKAYKTLEEAISWMDVFLKNKLQNDSLNVIVAAPFPFLMLLSKMILSARNVALAAQDVSMFDEGAYTGEVTARMLQGRVSYVIIGHSERRTNNSENDNVVSKKIEQAVKYDLSPILCIQNEQNVIPQKTAFVAYEPVESIGTGKNENLNNVVTLKKKLNLPQNAKFLYGGSVNSENINQYTSSPEIDGCLIGSYSLDPNDFFKLLRNV